MVLSFVWRRSVVFGVTIKIILILLNNIIKIWIRISILQISADGTLGFHCCSAHNTWSHEYDY